MSNSLIASLRSRVQGNAAPTVTESTPVPAPMPVQLTLPEPASLFGDPTKLPAPTEIPAAFRVDTKPADPINPPESQLPPAPLPEKASAEDDKPKKERKPRAKKEDKPDVLVADEQHKVTDFGFTLYVDCIPEGVPVTNADRLIEAADDIVVERQKGTEEPVQHYSFLSYGKGRGALALALEEVLDSTKPSAVFCTSTSDALPTLTKRASGIVRGVR